MALLSYPPIWALCKKHFSSSQYGKIFTLKRKKPGSYLKVQKNFQKVRSIRIFFFYWGKRNKRASIVGCKRKVGQSARTRDNNHQKLALAVGLQAFSFLETAKPQTGFIVVFLSFPSFIAAGSARQGEPDMGFLNLGVIKNTGKAGMIDILFKN